MSNSIVAEKDLDISNNLEIEIKSEFSIEPENVQQNIKDISDMLEEYHCLFYQLWGLGKPNFTLELPTAAVSFDIEGFYMNFLFNPAFWNCIDKYTKAFICSHESLHVILDHGKRLKKYKDKRLANIAADIVINHMLVSSFGFDREKLFMDEEKMSNYVREMNKHYGSKNVKEIKDVNGEKIKFNKRPFYESIIWIDTVFSEEDIIKYEIKEGESVEYYYTILSRLSKKNKDQAGSGVMNVDDHDSMGDFSDKIIKDYIDSNLSDNMTDEEKRDLKERIGKSKDLSPGEKEGDNPPKSDSKKPGGKEAGNIAANLVYNADVKKVSIKRKWETVIKKWMRKFNDEDAQVEQWAIRNRRYHNLSPDYLMPNDIDDEFFIPKKINVWFFQDTSGSCVHLKDRFFNAAKSLPKDKFNINMFCFDTKVYETSLESGKLYGFGGTSFSILENYIQNKVRKDDIPYPDAVFVITDGYGDNISPEKPDNWHWFLSTDYDGCINKNCNIHKLSDYE